MQMENAEDTALITIPVCVHIQDVKRKSIVEAIALLMIFVQ